MPESINRAIDRIEQRAADAGACPACNGRPLIVSNDPKLFNKLGHRGAEPCGAIGADPTCPQCGQQRQVIAIRFVEQKPKEPRWPA